MIHEKPPTISLDHHKEDLAVEEFYGTMNSEADKLMVKLLLQPLAEELSLLELDKEESEAHTKLLNKKIQEKESQIRTLWEPFSHGSDCNEFKFDGFKLQMNEILNISVDDNEAVTDWLLNHGYENVLKYQIHPQTLKSIGKDLYQNKKSQVIIPGVNYSSFSKIKIKKI